MPKSKAYSNPLPSMADEQRYGTKCHELRTKIREIERENQNIQLKIHQSKKNISRLRIERSVLYEALAAMTTTAAKAAELPIPPQVQQANSGASWYSTSNPIPSASIPSTHNNGYHPQNVPNTNRAFNEAAAPPPNNHAPPTQVPNRNFNNRSTEPVSLNGITGLLNSNNNSHHLPRPSISHGQYPQNLPTQQTQVANHRMPGNPHQLAPISADPTTNTRYSSAASDSPTASNNHFPHHQMGGRSMSVSSHHHHNRYPSPHHHHHHHHQHHPTEHLHSNPSSSSVLPSLRPHPTGPQTHSNGNGIPIRPDGRGEAEGEEEEEEEEEEEDEEDEEEADEVEGSIKGASTSLRPADDEMEIDAEGDEE